jgi:hypothetical protein
VECREIKKSIGSIVKPGYVTFDPKLQYKKYGKNGFFSGLGIFKTGPYLIEKVQSVVVMKIHS